MKTRHLIGLMALAAAALHGQTTVHYWSPTKPDCSSLGGETPIGITDSNGKILGYSCFVTGTFAWLAAGAGWSSAIRVAAPASGAVGVVYLFYDKYGNELSMDATGELAGTGSSTVFVLAPNQPAELDLVGATLNAPDYNSTATGSVFAAFFCPSAATCADLLPQLIYSALPSIPWSLSVPIAWDYALTSTWSGVGMDDGGANLVSLVIYNEDIVATRYTVNVYDASGTLVGTGKTPLIPPLQNLGSDGYGQGGTYGALLKDVISTPLPAGVFKILVDGGPGGVLSAVVMLQFNGPSATSLQVAFDSTSTHRVTAAVARKENAGRLRVESMARQMFRAVAK